MKSGQFEFHSLLQYLEYYISVPLGTRVLNKLSINPEHVITVLANFCLKDFCWITIMIYMFVKLPTLIKLFHFSLCSCHFQD